MAQKRIKHTDQEWFELITECRSSKLKVKVWCEQHGITAKALYYHTRRLRQKGYPVPQTPAPDLQQDRQEVVCLGIKESPGPGRCRRPDPVTGGAGTAVCLNFHGTYMEVTNHAGKEVISNLFQALLESC